MSDFYTTAKVKVILNIPVSSSWGPECSVAQVQGQAADEAKRTVEKMVKASGLSLYGFEIDSIQVAIVEKKGA